MGNGSGDCQIYEVFDPPWWKAYLWIVWWFFSRGRTKGTLIITIAGVPKEVRCRSVSKVVPPPITFPTSGFRPFHDD